MNLPCSFATMHRRKFLRGTGVALALPVLDALLPRVKAASAVSRTNMVCICTSLGLHAPFLFPSETGPEYKLTPYLEVLKDQRRDFTIFSGLSHPDQTGANGHTLEMTWLTSARFPASAGSRIPSRWTSWPPRPSACKRGSRRWSWARALQVCLTRAAGS